MKYIQNKIDEIRLLMEGEGADMYVITSKTGAFWLTKFVSSFATIILTQDKAYFATDTRYLSKAKSEIKGLKVIEYTPTLLKELMVTHDVDVLGFEPGFGEGDHLINVPRWIFSLEAELRLEGKELKPIYLEPIQGIKYPNEILAIQDSLLILEKMFASLKDFIKPGMSEKDIKHEAAKQMVALGGDEWSFDPIVAAGAHSAIPHHSTPTNYVVAEGDYFKLDMGVFKNGYTADITRTFKVGEGDTEKLDKAYDVVLEANKLGISLIKPGVTCSEIYQKVFDFIESKGYGEYFTHGLGHGIGVYIHEFPSLSLRGGDTVLQPGMVVTIEPGIYFEGLGGIRIEDDILITKDGAEVLSANIPKERNW